MIKNQILALMNKDFVSLKTVLGYMAAAQHAPHAQQQVLALETRPV